LPIKVILAKNVHEKQKLSPLVSLAKKTQKITSFHRWYPWPKRLKNKKLSPLVTLAKNSQGYFFKNG